MITVCNSVQLKNASSSIAVIPDGRISVVGELMNAYEPMLVTPGKFLVEEHASTIWFTSSVADCVRACMRTAENVFGVFIGGNEKKYVNEAWTSFVN